MIAMALACDPKVLIADEPTTALDVTIQAQILAYSTQLKDSCTWGCCSSPTTWASMAGHADRVMVMYAGRIVDQAPVAELFRNVRHPYTEALLEAIPKPGQDASQRLYSIPGQPPDLTAPPPYCRFARAAGTASRLLQVIRARPMAVATISTHAFTRWGSTARRYPPLTC